MLTTIAATDEKLTAFIESRFAISVQASLAELFVFRSFHRSKIQNRICQASMRILPPTIKHHVTIPNHSVAKSFICLIRISDWREKYPEVEERMAEAREKARLKMLQRIKRAAESDWRAAAEFLRLSFPADYRRGSNTSVEVNTAVQTGIVISEEKRQALIAQRERILKATAAKELEAARKPAGD